MRHKEELITRALNDPDSLSAEELTELDGYNNIVKTNNFKDNLEYNKTVKQLAHLLQTYLKKRIPPDTIYIKIFELLQENIHKYIIDIDSFKHLIGTLNNYFVSISYQISIAEFESILDSLGKYMIQIPYNKNIVSKIRDLIVKIFISNKNFYYNNFSVVNKSFLLSALYIDHTWSDKVKNKVAETSYLFLSQNYLENKSFNMIPIEFIATLKLVDSVTEYYVNINNKRYQHLLESTIEILTKLPKYYISPKEFDLCKKIFNKFCDNSDQFGYSSHRFDQIVSFCLLHKKYFMLPEKISFFEYDEKIERALSKQKRLELRQAFNKFYTSDNAVQNYKLKKNVDSRQTKIDVVKNILTDPLIHKEIDVFYDTHNAAEYLFKTFAYFNKNSTDITNYEKTLLSEGLKRIRSNDLLIKIGVVKFLLMEKNYTEAFSHIQEIFKYFQTINSSIYSCKHEYQFALVGLTECVVNEKLDFNAVSVSEAITHFSLDNLEEHGENSFETIMIDFLILLIAIKKSEIWPKEVLNSIYEKYFKKTINQKNIERLLGDSATLVYYDNIYYFENQKNLFSYTLLDLISSIYYLLSKNTKDDEKNVFLSKCTDTIYYSSKHLFFRYTNIIKEIEYEIIKQKFEESLVDSSNQKQYRNLLVIVEKFRLLKLNEKIVVNSPEFFQIEKYKASKYVPLYIRILHNINKFKIFSPLIEKWKLKEGIVKKIELKDLIDEQKRRNDIPLSIKIKSNFTFIKRFKTDIKRWKDLQAEAIEGVDIDVEIKNRIRGKVVIYYQVNILPRKMIMPHSSLESNIYAVVINNDIDNNIHTIKLSADVSDVEALVRNTLSPEREVFNQGLRALSIEDAKENVNPKKRLLYKYLLKEIEQKIISTPSENILKHLVVVPHRFLFYVPFSGLLDDEVLVGNKFNGISYVPVLKTYSHYKENKVVKKIKTIIYGKEAEFSYVKDKIDKKRDNWKITVDTEDLTSSPTASRKVPQILSSSDFIYFVCHGEYDPHQKEYYLKLDRTVSTDDMINEGWNFEQKYLWFLSCKAGYINVDEDEILGLLYIFIIQKSRYAVVSLQENPILQFNNFYFLAFMKEIESKNQITDDLFIQAFNKAKKARLQEDGSRVLLYGI